MILLCAMCYVLCDDRMMMICAMFYVLCAMCYVLCDDRMMMICAMC